MKIISGDIIYSANRTRKFDFINNGIIKISSKRFFAAVRFPPLTPPALRKFEYIMAFGKERNFGVDFIQ